MDLEKAKVKITRRGTGTDTKYSVLPIGTIDEKSLKLIEAVELNVLNEKAVVESPDDFGPLPDSPDVYEDSQIPF
jgi:hypothetical protein